jgi:hypothetical protein
MIFVHWLILVGLLLIASVGPGLFFVRHFHWKPRETWSASIGLSLLLLYAASFLIYLTTDESKESPTPAPRLAYWSVSACCLLLTLASGRDLLTLLGNRVLRRQCWAFLWLFIWGMLLLSLVRHYGGGGWFGDWLEHYQRTRFFVAHGPLDFKYLGAYPLPARPPLMNLVAGFFLAQVGLDFVPFQIVFLFLNLLVFFPLCLLAPLLSARGRSNLPILVFFLMANPMLWQNATWTWTKLLTGFYVLLALWLFVRGWQKEDAIRMAASFVALAAGFLVHYSAGPYLFFLACWYFAVIFPKRRRRWRELVGLALPSAAILATWFGWSMATYGAATTFGSNSSLTDYEHQTQESPALTALDNIVDSIVPHPLHTTLTDFNQKLFQPSAAGKWRDYFFLIYQTNFVFAPGLVAGPLLLYLLFKEWLRPSFPDRAWRWFWPLFVVVSGVLGVMVHRGASEFGLAHICGQPLVLLGLAFLAARYPGLPTSLRWLGLAGSVVDFLLGVMLHFQLENRVPALRDAGDKWVMVPSPDDPSWYALENWTLKFRTGYSYWGDQFTQAAGIIDILLILGFVVALVRAIRWLQTGRGQGSGFRGQGNPPHPSPSPPQGRGENRF